MAFSKGILFSFLFLALGLRNASTATVCSENYAPCLCQELDSGDWEVICDRVLIGEVVQVLGKTLPRNLASFTMTFSPADSGTTVPADFLADKRVASLTLRCSDPSHLLIIDSNAFAYSSELVRSVNIAGCEIANQTDFGFMATFNQLTSLSLVNLYNFNSFKGIPSQSNLYYLAILGCRGFDMLNDATVALPGLHILYLSNNQLTDGSAARVLSSLAASSFDSLEELRLYDNHLTEIPSLIPSFNKLKQLMMERNDLRVIKSHSLAFPAVTSLDYLNLGSNAIEIIEAGAFAGNFRNVYLQQNHLTRFEADVFKPMLETIEESVYGKLSLYENQFICDCHLSWLIQDHRHFLDYMEGARCANSTSFNDLIPEGYNDCKLQSFICPEDGNYPGETQCSDYFYMCSNSVPFKVYCPSGLIYNPSIEICDWAAAVPSCA